MENPGYIALSRLIAQQRALDVRASNVANMNTPGYKAENVVFSDYMLKQRGVSSPPGGQTIQMVQDRATYRDFDEGQTLKTGNPLDLALLGSGFFSVSTPRGTRYTGRTVVPVPGRADRRHGREPVAGNGWPSHHRAAW